MDCGEEVAALRREVGPVVGGEGNLQFDLMAGRMEVSAPASAATNEQIVAAAARAGLRAAPASGAAAGAPPWWERHGRTLATVASGATLLLGVGVHAVASGSVLEAIGAVPASLPSPVVTLYLLATAAGAAFVLPRAWAATRALRPDMNLLMTIAVAGAISLGQLLEAATVSFLFALALRLESWSVGRARRAVRALLDLEPPLAHVVERLTGVEVDRPSGQVRVGETIVVRPGERIPLDGVVRSGRAAVDTAPVTGESTPREISPGGEVFAGTIAIDGALEIEVTRPASDTVLARIVRRVAEAGRHRARAERWVDRFARIYTPTVLATAVVVALAPPLLGAGSWSSWFYRALVLLVIGCPCALVISTPVSVVAGLAAAARRGVLVKGGEILELPARLGAVAFDKTGTLTEGRLTVAAVHPHNGHDARGLLAVAAAVERRSSHPVAKAIVTAALAQGIEPQPAQDLQSLPGRGAEGRVGGTLAWLGSRRLMEERGEATGDLLARAVQAESSGQTVVVVGEQGHVCGLIGLSDRPRDEAPAALAWLARLGVSRVAMVTGDNLETATALAGLLGIGEVHAALLPDDKIAVVEGIRRELDPQGKGRRRLVAFVGDGINDAPALAAADLGVAFGNGASDAAIETADVALVATDLRRIPWLIRHSRRVLAVIRANIAFALAVKAAFLVATVIGHASLWAAIAADMGASLLVTANSLRLLSTPSGKQQKESGYQYLST